MSRIGRMPIPLPDGVEVAQEGNRLTVKGPLGTLERELHPEMTLERGDGTLRIVRPSDEPRHRALHGLTRTLVNNMVTGVTSGFTKNLEISGVGYRAQLQGEKLVLALGY
jgi:large subunit ribosomal protein L6